MVAVVIKDKQQKKIHIKIFQDLDKANEFAYRDFIFYEVVGIFDHVSEVSMYESMKEEK